MLVEQPKPHFTHKAGITNSRGKLCLHVGAKHLGGLLEVSTEEDQQQGGVMSQTTALSVPRAATTMISGKCFCFSRELDHWHLHFLLFKSCVCQNDCQKNAGPDHKPPLNSVFNAYHALPQQGGGENRKKISWVQLEELQKWMRENKTTCPSLTQVTALPPSKQWPPGKALFTFLTHFIAEHGLK